MLHKTRGGGFPLTACEAPSTVYTTLVHVFVPRRCSAVCVHRRQVQTEVHVRKQRRFELPWQRQLNQVLHPTGKIDFIINVHIKLHETAAAAVTCM